MFDIERCTERILDTDVFVVNLTEIPLHYYCEGKSIEIEGNDSSYIVEKSSYGVFKFCNKMVKYLKSKYQSGIFIIIIDESYSPYVGYTNENKNWQGCICDNYNGKNIVRNARDINAECIEVQNMTLGPIENFITCMKYRIKIVYLSLENVYLHIRVDNKEDWKTIIAGIILLYVLIAVFITSKL